MPEFPFPAIGLDLERERDVNDASALIVFSSPLGALRLVVLDGNCARSISALSDKPIFVTASSSTISFSSFVASFGDAVCSESSVSRILLSSTCVCTMAALTEAQPSRALL